MSVYLIWAEGTTFFKIGHSKNVRSRLSDFKVACPHELHVAATIKTDTPEQLEAELHSRWAKYRSKGEWFAIPVDQWPELLSSYGYNPVLISRLVDVQLKATDKVMDFHAFLVKKMIELDRSSLQREIYSEGLRHSLESAFEQAASEAESGWVQYRSLQRVALGLQAALAVFLSQDSSQDLEDAECRANQALEAFEAHNKRFHQIAEEMGDL